MSHLDFGSPGKEKKKKPGSEVQSQTPKFLQNMIQFGTPKYDQCCGESAKADISVVSTKRIFKKNSKKNMAKTQISYLYFFHFFFLETMAFIYFLFIGLLKQYQKILPLI
jgi:hypothetical protein